MVLLGAAKHATRRCTFAGKAIVASAVHAASPPHPRPHAARRQFAALAGPDGRFSPPTAARGVMWIARLRESTIL